MKLSARRPSAGKTQANLSELVDSSVQDTIRLSVILEREMHTKLKMLAAKDQTTVSQIVKNLLSDLLKD